jgi:hypothetical protein
VRFRAEDFYTRAEPRLAPGVIFLNLPIIFTPPRLAAISVGADGTLRTQDFEDAWRTAPEVRRNQGIPVLVRAKPRPVLVVRVGAGVTDTAYQRSVWVAPLYGETDPPRRGPNVFPLPAWPVAGLSFAGYADLYQATMLPVEHLRAERYACELSTRAMTLFLGAISIWAEADPVPRLR